MRRSIWALHSNAFIVLSRKDAIPSAGRLWRVFRKLILGSIELDALLLSILGKASTGVL
jgi:hypothetical protein